MASSISGIAAAQQSVTYAVTPAASNNASRQPEDTVRLSQSAQVSQLSTQGQTPTEISLNLGISLATVDSDLGIVAAAIASASEVASPPVR